MAGFRFLKFESSFGFHGWTRPLVAKYLTQPTYGRKRSGLKPARILASASDSFVMYVNCGLLRGCAFTYDANIAWPPSLPYPAQSRTLSRPVSAASRTRAASATAFGPARIAAPPATAPSLRRSSRLRGRSGRLVSSVTSIAPFPVRDSAQVEPSSTKGSTRGFTRGGAVPALARLEAVARRW